MQIENYLIRKSSLEKLFNNLVGNGKTVYAPKASEKRILFEEVKAFSEITDNYLVTTNAAKSVVFPRTEKLFSYKKTKDTTEIIDASTDAVPEVVLWGTRPCDAAAFIPLTDTFNGDYPDVLYNNRRGKVYLLSFSCATCDEYCFCTSVTEAPEILPEVTFFSLNFQLAIIWLKPLPKKENNWLPIINRCSRLHLQKPRNQIWLR